MALTEFRCGWFEITGQDTEYVASIPRPSHMATFGMA